MKTMYATRAFKDAGTDRSFAAGEPISDVEKGVLENYEAAGLVSADVEADAVDAAAPVTPIATEDTAAPVPAKRKAAPRRRKAAAAS